MKKIWLLFSSYFLVILALFFYSFTQVDLSLTLSRASIFQDIEKNFQYIGYFNRPLSTAIFVVILGALFIHYLIFVYLAIKNKIKTKTLWKLIIATTVILTFCYNAFSYDLFNYIFDAKIITFYNQNPYLHKALDFPKDPMLSFMHWTHRTYPYGPLWLVMTVPFSYLGLGFFLPTFFIFKAFIASTFIGSAYLIQKIVRKVNSKYEAFALASFALSPFVIIEALVDSHNDMPMMFLGILSLYFALNKKWLFSILAVVASALTKQASVFMIAPIIFFALLSYKKINFSYENLIKLSIISMLTALIYVVSKIDIQPWYYLWVFPLISLLKPNKYVFLTSTGFSLGLLLRYAPFLYQGDWNGMVPFVELYLTVISTITFFLIALSFDIYKKLFVTKKS